MLRGRGADYQRAIRHSLGDGSEYAGGSEYLSAADRRDRFAEGCVVRVYQAQIRKTEIGQGTRRRADVQRVSGRDENDCERVRDTTILAWTSTDFRLSWCGNAPWCRIRALRRYPGID
jgi:hypothetical protein